MTDLRYQKLAKLLVEYSTELKKGDHVLLDMIDVPDEFTIELVRAARKAGALPVVEVRHTRVNRELLRQTDQAHASLLRDLELFRMKKMQAYIAIRGTQNSTENADVASERMAQALTTRGYHVHFDEFAGAGHVDQGPIHQSLPTALTWLWRGFKSVP